MPFQLPIKGDIDRTLSNLMHDARHRLMIEQNRIMGEASMAGALQSSRVIVTVASFADQIHEASMKQATPILLDFIQRMHLPPAEINSWARPHLENLGNSLLGVIKPNGFPNDHQRIVHQYHAVFQQRLDGVLRDVEIGFIKEAGFARTEQMEAEEEWITAAEAVRLLMPVFNSEYMAQQTICKRAHNGLIKSRAQRFMKGEQAADNIEIPKVFWWAEGGTALNDNWPTGDFDTWIDRGETHLQAFGVSFLRADIKKMIPAEMPAPAMATPSAPSIGGRPPADWWEDLLIDLCFQHFRGDLKPETQAEVERAMQQWIVEHGRDAATSTIRKRAQKLWQAIKREAEN